MESWVVTLRQASDPTSRSLLEEFVRLGELAHRLVKPLCQVKQAYDLLDWRRGRKYCLGVWGLGFRVQGLGSRVYRVQGLGFRV